MTYWTTEKDVVETEMQEPHPMFDELRILNSSFQDFYYDVTDEKARDDKATETVERFIEVMKKYLGEITAETLLNKDNRMGGYIDPVFATLVRLMYGPLVLTQKVYCERIRNEWCGADIPSGYDKFAAAREDRDFIDLFSKFPFSTSGNYKFRALQRMGRGRLEELCRWRKDNQKAG